MPVSRELSKLYQTKNIFPREEVVKSKETIHDLVLYEKTRSPHGEGNFLPDKQGVLDVQRKF